MSQDFTIYDLTTGAILRRGSAPNPAIQVQEGEGWLLGHYDPAAYEVDLQTAAPIARDQGVVDAERLETKRRDALRIMRSRIIAAREVYITDLPGQELIYNAKEIEAKAWIADPSPDPADYPMLSAEVGITEPTADDLATLWVTNAAKWRALAAQLEAARMTANIAISAATTQAEIDAALAALESDLSAMPDP